nr:hypothetical protein [Tanacetum cinerariifolium]
MGYASCVKQFWTTAKVKKVNDQEQIQAFVDKQKVIITKESIRRDLDEAKGTACLPNDTIFEELASMGYEYPSQKLTFYKSLFSPQWKFLIHTILQCLSAKTTAWNEFSSTMASAIICLANNQKFTFSKYSFNNMVKHLEGGVKFLMFLRFLQVFLDKQVEGMAKHKEIYVMSSRTKKIFANMKRQGQGTMSYCIHNVRSDGNCGFQALSACLNLHEDSWSQIRLDLWNELNEHEEYYTRIFGSKDVSNIYRFINFTRAGPAPEENWMIMPDTGLPIASRYNRVVQYLNINGSNTCFPLWSSPPESQRLESIVIALVHGMHFVKLNLRGDYPICSSILEKIQI